MWRPKIPASLLPSARRTEPSKTPQRTGLRVSTGVVAVLFLVPLLLMLYVALVVLMVQAGAAALRDARGLDESTYEAAFALATALVVALGISTVPGRLRALAGRVVPWYRRALVRPTLALAALAVGSWVAELRGADLPDVLPSALWLAVMGSVALLWPFAFAGFGIRGIRWLYRFGAASSHRTGLIGGVAITLGLVTLTDGLGVAVSDDPWDDGIIAELGLDQLEWPDEPIQDSREALRLHASGTMPIRRREPARKPARVNPSTSAGLASAKTRDAPTDYGRVARRAAAPTGDPLVDCMMDLFTQPSPPERPAFEQAKRMLIRQRWAPDLADGIAKDALIKTCVKDAQAPLRDRIPYLIKVATNRARRKWRRMGQYEQALCEIGDRGPSMDESPEVIAFERAMCSLGSTQREIIELLAHGYKPGEIAELRGITPAAARQQVRRARVALRAALGGG